MSATALRVGSVKRAFISVPKDEPLSEDVAAAWMVVLREALGALAGAVERGESRDEIERLRLEVDPILDRISHSRPSSRDP